MIEESRKVEDAKEAFLAQDGTPERSKMQKRPSKKILVLMSRRQKPWVNVVNSRRMERAATASAAALFAI